MKTFEEYLKEICFKINPCILDDEMSDFFNDWLRELDREDYIEWAELFGKEMYLKGKEAILEITMREIEEIPQMKGTLEALDKLTIRK